jgi:hypothetical protein
VLLPLLEWFHVPPAAVALGASYFQRLMASCDGLAADAVAAGFFSYQPGKDGQPVRPGCNPWLPTEFVCSSSKVTSREQFGRPRGTSLLLPCHRASNARANLVSPYAVSAESTRDIIDAGSCNAWAPRPRFPAVNPLHLHVPG